MLKKTVYIVVLALVTSGAPLSRRPPGNRRQPILPKHRPVRALRLAIRCSS